jgi:hypothetical protein
MFLVQYLALLVASSWFSVTAVASTPPSPGTSSQPPTTAAALAVWPTQPAQGQTLWFRLPLDGPARNPRATFGDRTIPISQRGEALAGVIGLGITESIGSRRLRITWRDGSDRPREVSRLLQIRKTEFPVRHLTMKRSTERLYTFPGSKAEDAAVSRAVRASTPGWLWDGPFRIPAQGRLSTPFGVKRVRNNRTHYYHRGTDIAAPTGRAIVAPQNGRVVLSRDFRKYGGTVVLDHGGGVTTLYLHMSARSIREGQRVAIGDPLGEIGATGVATGPHLHWGLYVHGDAVNPLFWTRLPAGFFRDARRQ